jgi:protein-L-isoaspartate(D-aspartate) O-methyltransferase
MTTDLARCRRFFAEEIAAIANLRTQALVEALEAVPRERFLRPGPWLVRGEHDAGVTRVTPDADARHVYHNHSIAIDPQRQLFNGAPGVVASWMDALALRPGAHVLHVGAGLGYYSAIMAHLVGPEGRVVAIEVDPSLAAEARVNLTSSPWVDVQTGDGTSPLTEPFDAILVSAGLTHPQRTWLDALTPGGCIVLPLTVSIPAMGPLGKGVTVLFTKTSPEAFLARVLGMIAIYSAVGLRDDGVNLELGRALASAPFPRFTTLRLDGHEQAASCWLHAGHFCLGTAS